MSAVEFQARVENGAIVVPDEYQKALVEAGLVTVIILKPSQKQPSRPDIMDDLTKNPIRVDRFLTRTELYDRTP